jgi:hypothetical protein
MAWASQGFTAARASRDREDGRYSVSNQRAVPGCKGISVFAWLQWHVIELTPWGLVGFPRLVLLYILTSQFIYLVFVRTK